MIYSNKKSVPQEKLLMEIPIHRVVFPYITIAEVTVDEIFLVLG